MANWAMNPAIAHAPPEYTPVNGALSLLSLLDLRF
jgi:hypothetical protein